MSWVNSEIDNINIAKGFVNFTDPDAAVMPFANGYRFAIGFTNKPITPDIASFTATYTTATTSQKLKLNLTLDLVSNYWPELAQFNPKL